MNYLGFLKDFLPYKMKRQVKELFASTILVNLALSMVMIFEPIYLYKIGYSLQKIMLFYLITYLIYFLIMPLGGKFARKKGYELGMLLGTILFSLFYIGLFFIEQYPFLFYLVPFILALQKTFYWPAYHADFARFSDDSEEGREIGGLTMAVSLVYIIGPALAGFIILQWGFGALFTFATIIFLASNIPTLITKEEFAIKDFSYKDAYLRLISKKNRKSFIAYLGFGEELIVLVVWPVFISIIITDIFDLGLIITLATLITSIITLYIGRITDSRNKKSILSLGASFYSLAWFIRIFIINQLGVFFVDTLSRLSKNVIAVPLTAITYERAKSRSIMKTVLFFEMSLVVGKLIALLLIYTSLFFITDEIFAFKLTFILAGGMSLLYLLIDED